MKLEITQQIVFKPNDNEPENIVTLKRLTIGGSTSEFKYADGYSPEEGLANNFEVLEFKQFSFDVGYQASFEKTFDQNIINFPDITSIHIYAVESTDPQVKIPVRFELSIGDGSANMTLGGMSGYTMDNIINCTLTTFTISKVFVPKSKKAQLMVLVGLKTKYGSIN